MPIDSPKDRIDDQANEFHGKEKHKGVFQHHKGIRVGDVQGEQKNQQERHGDQKQIEALQYRGDPHGSAQGGHGIHRLSGFIIAYFGAYVK